MPEPVEPAAPAEVAPADVLPPGIRPYVSVPALNPMQAGAIPLILRGDRNVVVAAPTGSGKTLVAEVALLRECRERGRAGVYLAPMRAIAAEKRDDWRRLEDLGLRVYKTTGEDEAFDPARALAADIIVATPEKWDSVGRRALSPELVARVGTIVMDEVHLVDDGARGAGQEAMLARLPRLFPAARIIAMSGTLANADAVARWLDADLYESRWRPIALSKRIAPYRPSGGWEADEEARNSIAATVARDTAAGGGAVLVFCGSRKGVERCALHLARALRLPPPPVGVHVQSGALRAALAGGVGFHHAGLAREDRAVAERLFRSGALRALVATSTVAAGVNLPARVVVVRDLQLGTSKLSAAGLLQMAGRAGRPGLETEGHCVVIAPEREVDRVKGMLEGHPVGSRLGDDLATHLNTETALGLARSRADVDAWYGRTLHRHVARKRADPGEALRLLLKEGFAREEGGVLGPTGLGRLTADLMIRVPTAAALERHIAAGHARRADPDRLEEDILVAACGLPVELDELADRQGDDGLYRALTAYDSRLDHFSQGRVEYLAVAACLLSGLPVEGLPIENPSSVRAAVARELPRYLGFLARRANERTPGAPDVAVAAADLALALEYGVRARGAGPLLDLVRRAYPPDEARRERVAREYTRLRKLGVTALAEALPHLAHLPAVQRVAGIEPALPVSLEVADGALIARVGGVRGPARVHARVVAARELVITREVEGEEPVRLAALGELGPSGAREVAVECVAIRSSGPTAWRYGSARTTVTIPGVSVIVDDDALDRALRMGDYAAASDVPDTSKPAGSGVYEGAPWHALPAEMRRVVANAPAGVRRTGLLLVGQVAGEEQRARVVARLLRRRALRVPDGAVRPLSTTVRAETLNRSEGAALAVALLCACGVQARAVTATLDGDYGALCAWKRVDRWHALPIWPARTVRTHREPLAAWDDGGAAEGPDATETAAVGWGVLTRYGEITRRSLPLAAAATAPPPDGDGGKGQDGPRCPDCEGPMRPRTNKSSGSSFWGCARYPACKGTRPA